MQAIKVLEANGDIYKDEFPIKINPVEFTISEEEISNWKDKNKLDTNLTAGEILETFKQKYEIENNNIEEVRKIIAVRYGIDKNGYSSMKAYTISDSISKGSVAIFEEQNLKFPASRPQC